VFPQPFAISQSNDRYAQLTWVFTDTSTKLSLGGNFQVPKNYVGTANLVLVWTATATSGNVVWDFDYKAVSGNDAESLDPSSDDQNATGTDAAPGTTLYRMEFTIALTDGNFAVDDTIQFNLSRDGAAADTMAAAAILIDAFFEYADA